MQYTGSKVAFSIFGIEVHWYGIIIITGMLLATILSAKELKKRGYSEEIIYDLAMWVLPAAIIGARLYYVIFEWNQFNGDILKIISIRDGGLAIHGGVIAAVLVGYIYVKIKNIDFFLLSDIIMIFLPLAQSIGRWGNFINNEAHGGETDLPWALIIEGKKYHPTFLYESISTFLIFLFLFMLYKKKNLNKGIITSIYIVSYSIVRFFIEGLRTDSLWIGQFRQAQVISVVLIIFGIILFLLSKKNFFENK